MFSGFDIIDFTSEEDASSLAIGFWFDNIGSTFSFLLGFIILSKLDILLREHPSEGKEVILIGEFVPEIHETDSQEVFSGDGVDSWEMVNFLEEVHSDEDVGVDRVVGPEDIPVSRFDVGLDFPVEILCYFAHH